MHIHLQLMWLDRVKAGEHQEDSYNKVPDLAVWPTVAVTMCCIAHIGLFVSA